LSIVFSFLLLKKSDNRKQNTVQGQGLHGTKVRQKSGKCAPLSKGMPRVDAETLQPLHQGGTSPQMRLVTGFRVHYPLEKQGMFGYTDSIARALLAV